MEKNVHVPHPSSSSRRTRSDHETSNRPRPTRNSSQSVETSGREWKRIELDDESDSSMISDISHLIPSISFSRSSTPSTPPTPPETRLPPLPSREPPTSPRATSRSRSRPLPTRSPTPPTPPTPPPPPLPKLRPPTPTGPRSHRVPKPKPKPVAYSLPVASTSYSIPSVPIPQPRPRTPTPEFIPPPAASTPPWRLPLARAFFALPSYQEPFRSIETLNLLSPSEQDHYASIIKETFQNFSTEVVGARWMVEEYEESEGEGESMDVEEPLELGWIVDDVGLTKDEHMEEGEVEEDEQFGYGWLMEGGRKKRKRLEGIETSAMGVVASAKSHRRGAILGAGEDEEFDDEEESGRGRKRRKGKGRFKAQIFRAPRLCFNCSSPSHALSDCPQPHDRLAIQAGRQLYQTVKDQALASQALEDQYAPSSSSSDDEDDSDEEEDHVKAFSGRFWDADVEEAIRLEYLERFKPGVLSEELKEALGGGEEQESSSEIGSWIWDGMVRWGYPPGWFSAEDPKEKARRIMQPPPETILAGSKEDSVPPLQVYGATSLLSSLETPAELNASSSSGSDIDVDDDDSSASSSSSSSDSSSAPSSPKPPRQPRRRWASYPTSLFSSQLLPAFSFANPIPLPPVQEIEDENDRRKRIWEKLQASAGRSGGAGDEWTWNGGRGRRDEVGAGGQQVLPSSAFDFQAPPEAPRYPPTTASSNPPPPPPPPPSMPPPPPPPSMPPPPPPPPPPGSPPPPPPPPGSPPPPPPPLSSRSSQARGWSPVRSSSSLPRPSSSRDELPPLPSSRRDTLPPLSQSGSSRREEPQASSSSSTKRGDGWDRWEREDEVKRVRSADSASYSAFSHYTSFRRSSRRRSRSPSPLPLPPPSSDRYSSSSSSHRPRSRSPPPSTSSSLYRRNRLPTSASISPQKPNLNRPPSPPRSQQPPSPPPPPSRSSQTQPTSRRSPPREPRRRSRSPPTGPSLSRTIYGTRDDPPPEGRRAGRERSVTGQNYDHYLVGPTGARPPSPPARSSTTWRYRDDPPARREERYWERDRDRDRDRDRESGMRTRW